MSYKVENSIKSNDYSPDISGKCTFYTIDQF